MNAWLVKSQITCLNAIDSIKIYREKTTRALSWVGYALYRILPLGIILRLERVRCSLGLVAKEIKVNDSIATANFHCLSGNTRKLHYRWNAQRRKTLDILATWSCHPEIRRQISACAQQLDNVVTPFYQAGEPVILAPLHFVSDILAVMVAAQVPPKKSTVIVSSSADNYRQKDRQYINLDIDYCSIHQDNPQIANSMMTAIDEARNNFRNIIVFPDITPDFTAHTNDQRAARFACELFGRKGNLHNGVPRLARTLKATVVVYYLTFDSEIRIHIAPPQSYQKIKKELPCLIESAISQYPDDWMLWHSHSLFYING
jgi:lauroyl/myristoyl acyltransferase